MTATLLIALLPFAGLVSETTTEEGYATPTSQIDHLISAAHAAEDDLLKQSLTLEIWRAQSDDPRASALIEEYEKSAQNMQDSIAKKTATDAIAHLAASASFQLDMQDYRVGSVFNGEFDGPFTRIHPESGVWVLDVSDELMGMARTLRTAVVTQELATHHGHVLGWNVELVESAAFLSGTSVYVENGGIGWSRYQTEALPGLELSLEESVQWLDSDEETSSEGAGHLSDWIEEQRTES
ncbi:MAG: hypothetical protein VX519_04325 [Myxococcota bacterium]|nr:hypothetical protein [Myxococcota bacterium]